MTHDFDTAADLERDEPGCFERVFMPVLAVLLPVLAAWLHHVVSWRGL